MSPDFHRFVSLDVLVNVFALTISLVVEIELDIEPMFALLRADLFETNWSYLGQASSALISPE